MIIFFTIAANNYLPEAILLKRSLATHHPEAFVILVQPERPNAIQPQAKAVFNEVLTLHDLGYELPEKFAFLHDITELATAIKARAFQRIISTHSSADMVVYIDPDCFVYSNMQEIFSLLKNKADIILTPHHLADEDTYEGIHDNVFRTLKCGIFNLGFIALRCSIVGDAFLRWWTNKLDMLCHIDLDRGLFVDQKWIDLAVSFFDVTVLRHPGYNVANWNVSKRIVRISDGGPWVGDQQLRFFHFSGSRIGKDLKYLRKYDRINGGRSEDLRKQYKSQVRIIADTIDRSANEWSYGQYFSGELIDDFVRKYLRQHRYLLDSAETGFELSNEEWRARF